MKRCLFLLSFTALFLSIPSFAQEAKAPELRVQPDLNFFKLPDGIYFGECVGVALDSKGNVYVANRGKHPIIEFHSDGTFMRFIGDDLMVGAAHSVALDAQDNIWFIDAELDTAMKFDQQLRLQMVLSKKQEPWTYETHVVQYAERGPVDFYQPTGIAFAPDGSIFVTDGYGNSRVVHFSVDGKFIKDWERRGSDPGNFNTPHAIVIDSNGTLYVGDRQNRRTQIFDEEGKLLKIWTNVGAPWSLCMTKGPNPVIFSADGPAGRVYKLDLRGNVLGAFGKPGKIAGEMGWVHGIACPDENTVYAAEELNYRVQKFTIQPSH